MAKYYAPPGTGVQAPFGDSGETRVVEWDDSGVVEVPDDDDASVHFLAAFADSPAHPITSQPPSERKAESAPSPKKEK